MKIVIKCWRCNKLYEVSLFSYLVRCITNLLESGMWSYDLFCAEHEDNVVVIQSNIIATSERPDKEIPIVAEMVMMNNDNEWVKWTNEESKKINCLLMYDIKLRDGSVIEGCSFKDNMFYSKEKFPARSEAVFYIRTYTLPKKQI